ncbi:adenosylmethionine--8-amino-7-oxononanoate transaminase [Psittacicella hinzii]|uniref:adenosylmethionine--8-amino-7-oxononanoate transaminase n=1 Tax=Psittacicella hinzii TaxID=2028575 RepID=A0A3A1Y7B1_9GAMM|nr:adenosylmethionine--8-amino-7-oxononanoate transaminase [Psittacicella hinzii]RIY33401.1 adenosylmethionine--8-amino-7-oxononanoate transaminase [Psittacicella hinzii]
MNINFDSHIIHAYDSPYNTNNLLITKAKGIYMYDQDEKKYLDAISSWWSTSFGHANEKIVNAITRQAQSLPHVMFAGLTHEPALKLTENLLNLLNYKFDQIFYSDSGSVAVEVALKLAIQYQVAKGRVNKKKFISLKNGYHGDTWNTMKVSDPAGSFHQLFMSAETSNTYVISPPPALKFHSNVFNEEGKFTSLSEEEFLKSDFAKELIALLSNHGEEISGFICEPLIQGAGGFKFYDLRYIDKAIELCRQNNVLVIFDEIATGFGRTLADFAFEMIKNSPDIITLGKALTGGHISLGATAFTKEIALTIKANPPYAFLHGPTFMANPIATATANASVEIYRDNYSYKNAKACNLANKFAESYDLLKKSLLHYNKRIIDIRYIGPIFCIEFSQPLDKRHCQEFFTNKGIWLRPFNNILYILPPYIIHDDELMYLCNTIREFISSIEDLSTEQAQANTFV